MTLHQPEDQNHHDGQATVLGSGLVGVDATVVHIALPTIGRDLGMDFGALQRTVLAYTLTLAAFVLIDGSAGDRFGRRRVFLLGVLATGDGHVRSVSGELLGDAEADAGPATEDEDDFPVKSRVSAMVTAPAR